MAETTETNPAFYKIKYDAWGRQLSNTIAKTTNAAKLYTYNRLKYRSYYYDSDLWMYALGSRFYDSVLGRFINGDGLLLAGDVLGMNLYAYCENNPVMLCDSTGTRPIASERIDNETPEERSTSIDWMNNQTVNAKKVKPNFVPNPNKRKGSENRQPTGERERNVGHPNGEEHSRIPKENRGVKRMEPIDGLIVTTIVIIGIVADDASLAGILNDGALIPMIPIWLDYASELL